MAHMNGNLGFEEDIRPLFSASDRACMANRFDLWSWRDVRRHGASIRTQVDSGRMPPGGWPSDNRQRFSSWMNDGGPKLRPEKYSAFFRDLDSWTEYWDLYRPETNGKYFFGNGPDHPGHLAVFWPSPKTPQAEAFELWKEYAQFHRTSDGPELKGLLMQEISKPAVKEALDAIDELLSNLLLQHFPSASGGIDNEAYLDCVEAFAMDLLPLDQDRFDRVPVNDRRKDHSLRHTMDGAAMWFNWLAHLDCTSLVADAGDTRRSTRALLAAGCAVGCPMDFLFRDPSRGKTRPEYKSDDATLQLLQSRATRWSVDLTRGLEEGRDLYAIFVQRP